MKRIMTFAATLLIAGNALAQQALWNDSKTGSPVINEDGTVTFRYHAPKAVKVSVSGDFFPAPGVAELKEMEGGIWEYTTDFTVAPDMYLYTFNVDGLNVIDNNNMWVNRDIATLTSAFIVPGGRADLYTIQDVPHGTVSKVWYDSKTAGFDRRLSVYTPAGYDPTGKTRYPVVYILHGMGGDEDAWIEQGRAIQILDNLIAQGKAKPMIAVFTNGNISQEAAPGENSTGYIHPQIRLPKTMEGTFETSFPEVVKFIDSNYRTIARKQGRAVCGLSMGGFHTLHISINYPDMFAYSGMFSAAINRGRDSHIYEDFDSKLAIWFSKKPELLWIGCGESDFLIEENRNFVNKLKDKGYPHEYMENTGGHIWKNWRIYLTEFLPKIF